MRNILAQIPLFPEKTNPEGFRGVGPLGLEGVDADVSTTTFNTIISTTVGVMTIVAGIWFLINLIIGAISISTAGGDKAAYEAARKKIQNNVVGLIVVVAAIFLTELIGAFLGFDLITNPAEFVENI